MVKLIASIVATSALVLSVKALEVDAVSAVSLEEKVSLEAVSLEYSEAFASEEASAAEAWDIEVVEDDSGIDLMGQLIQYMQNLIYPEAEVDNLEETEEIQEAVELNENEAVDQKKVKRANYRRKMMKRAGNEGFQDEKGQWHYAVPERPEAPSSSFVAPKQLEVTVDPSFLTLEEDAFVVPEYQEFALSKQEIQDSPEMEAFPGFNHPNFFDPFLIGALIPKNIKSEIAEKVKSKLEAAAATNSDLASGLAKASDLIEKATKAFEDFKEKHKKTSAAEKPAPKGEN